MAFIVNTSGDNKWFFVFLSLNRTLFANWFHLQLCELIEFPDKLRSCHHGREGFKKRVVLLSILKLPPFNVYLLTEVYLINCVVKYNYKTCIVDNWNLSAFAGLGSLDPILGAVQLASISIKFEQHEILINASRSYSSYTYLDLIISNQLPTIIVNYVVVLSFRNSEQECAQG